MATKPERTALIFLSAVALAGGLVRMYHAIRPQADRVPVASGSGAALAGQRRAVDSATQAHQAGRGTAGRGRGAKPKGGGKATASTRTYRDKQPSVAPLATPGPSFPIDVDRASAAELEALPRIGPELAKRIVAEREAKGAFGSIDSLDKRVPGVGGALVKAIRTLVTFSGR